MTTLRGMTWDHPRGVDPLRAHAADFEKRRVVKIEWDARSLEDFEAFPLDELAARYDLMVIDHPHVGMAAASGCLLALDTVGREADLAALAGHTVGRSHESYFYDGHQWALAIDAAAQVSCRRAAFHDVPRTWAEVLALADDGRVLCPLAAVHAMMCLFTLSAHLGSPGRDHGQLFDPAVSAVAFDHLRDLANRLPDVCFTSNPIATFGQMIADDRYVYAPLIYGYVSYAREGKLRFGDMPTISAGKPTGSTLGGTGIAVSAKTSHRDIALDVAFELASAKIQRSSYAEHGGQPAHRDAWTDGRVNVSSHDFFRDTLATLDASYIRPRFDGYVAFQQQAGQLVARSLRTDHDAGRVIDSINDLFAKAQS